MPLRSGKRMLSIEIAGGCQNEAARPPREARAMIGQTQGANPESIMKSAAKKKETGSIRCQ